MWKNIFVATAIATLVTQISTQNALPLRCTLPMNRGSGNFALTYYYFDVFEGKCKEFSYRGNGGNDNRFMALARCEKVCLNSNIPSGGGGGGGGNVITTTTSRPMPARCTLKMEVGPCRALMPRYYYDTTTGTCRSFDWGGCGGTANRFLTLANCENICLRGNSNSSTSTTSTTTTTRPMPARCNSSVDSGPCKASLPRFYYDSATGTCRSFYWGGCGGTNNRFLTLANCQNICLRNR